MQRGVRRCRFNETSGLFLSPLGAGRCQLHFVYLALRLHFELPTRQPDGKVTMPPIEFDSSESFQFDGTPYTIAVYKTDNGFVAYGECLSCPRHRMKSETLAHMHLVKKECRELVRQHHAKNHASAESPNTR
jgi:hypothetical protein